jgi:hypothetical protein
LNRRKALNEAQRLRINPLMVSPSNHWNDWNKLSWIAARDVPIFTFEFLLFTFFPARGIASVLAPFKVQIADKRTHEAGLPNSGSQGKAKGRKISLEVCNRRKLAPDRGQ